ncbi:uncharacterized protein LOC119721327 isoform X2 [Patiria miniata]|uniref:Uncharacterized protein n=1 Tax=Patiria miniata TaxID=46514 RepID=A0A913Z6E2_PATMI|nr:uncharacterized protein LOC119721327 isoform X2 [Patiria miniata]
MPTQCVVPCLLMSLLTTWDLHTIIMARQLFFGESFNAEDEWRRLDASVNGDPMWGQGPPVPHPSWEIDDNQEDQQVSEEDSIDLTGPEYDGDDSVFDWSSHPPSPPAAARPEAPEAVAAADEDLVPRPYSPCPAFDVTSEDPNMEVRGHLLCFVGLHVYKNCLIPICTKKLLWLLRRSFITKTTQLSDG